MDRHNYEETFTDIIKDFFVSSTTRIVRLLVTAMASSLLLIIFSLNENISGVALAILSFALFEALAGYDGYKFSRWFWRTQDYFVGQLAPWTILYIIVMLSRYFMPGMVFDYFFFPFRILECFGVNPYASITFVAIFNFLLTTAMRMVGAPIGKRKYKRGIRR